MIHLRVSHEDREAEHSFEGSIVRIGRSRTCDLAFPELSFLSRQHCRIEIVQGHCEVTDLSSTNGVQVNGLYMRRGVLEAGDVVSISSLKIELLEYGPDAGAPEQIRPCLDCGFLIPINDFACPRCSGSVRLRKSHRIHRDHLRGYELKRKLGSGGMGIVFEAVRRVDHQTTAIKILKPHLARDPRYLVRFTEETRVLTVLDHPNIVKIHGRGSDSGLVYIDMELIAGDSVRGHISESRLDEQRALRLIWDAILGLDYAAQKKIIHGDVKPSNFLVDPVSGKLKLCDFGLAHLLDFSGTRAALSAESGSKKGTAAYAAPERFVKDAVPTLVGDIYSLGVSLFQMLSGELPFGSNMSARSTKRGDPRRNLPDILELCPEIRPSTGMIIQRMLAYEPSERYSTYREVQDDLGLLL